MTSTLTPLTRTVLALTGAAAASVLPTVSATGADHGTDRPSADTAPIVIGHRGAAGYRPEHTLAGYRLAIGMGADYIEPDLVETKDGVLVCRHENEIGGTTDVADHPEFADRETTKTIDGQQVTGWFVEDFTLAELKTLRAKERIPQLRPDNTRYDGRYQVPTLREVLKLARSESRRTGRRIGVIPEIKHGTYFDSIGLSMEEDVVRELKRAHLDRKKAKVAIQSFEVSNLRELDGMTKVQLVQLVDDDGQPADVVAAGGSLTYADMMQPTGLRDIARYADWVSPYKEWIIPTEADGTLGRPTTVVRDAHRAGLQVATWTFRDENYFLPAEFRRGADPTRKGDAIGEIQAYLDTGIDALFTDHPDTGVAAREEWLAQR